MVIVTRHDGVKFIAQAYREQLLTPNKRALLHEIRHLSSQQGQFVCFMRNMKRELEAIFSKEQGFLLGELVWDYFGRPDNLIYCESIAQSANCFLVIVRQGSVYFDNKLPCEQVSSELMPILADNHPYEIYTYGDVPLRNTETFGNATFTLPKKLIGSFNHLKNAVFPVLLTSSEFELQPLPQALRSKYLRHNRIFVIFSVFVLLMIAGWALLPSSHSTKVPVKTTIISTAYEQALMTPSPDRVIHELAQKIDELYLIPGWEVVKINYNNNNYIITLHSDDGDVWYLTNWAKQHYYDVHMTPDGMQLQLRSSLLSRQLPAHYAIFQTEMDVLIRRLSPVLPGNAIAVGDIQQVGLLQKVDVTLNLSDVSPDVFNLIGQELNALPVSISMDLQLKDGLISGKLQLSLWGIPARNVQNKS